MKENIDYANTKPIKINDYNPKYNSQNTEEDASVDFSLTNNSSEHLESSLSIHNKM